MHSLCMAYQVGSSSRITELLKLIDQWSYAHRAGNGTLSDREQAKLITKAFWRIKDHV